MKSPEQINYNLLCQAEAVLNRLEKEESRKGKLEIILSQLQNNNEIVSIHRKVIIYLMGRVGMPTYEQAVDKILYLEQQKRKSISKPEE